ncbi:ThuA domain-containing protein [Streptomyces sp. N2-109]|uniref:ThuA domain-containing protein n=1 Tax=Streptomyces gossypii TaxID=2883101 RepID=A0ABT2K006_9ACTN|nr:ThuA domain-containing protein [Streptomyces gossypii]MCT2593503.1 ThuA domain-containing protein [Streptomyces gossypii]
MKRTARLAILAGALLLGSSAIPSGYAAQDDRPHGEKKPMKGENVLVFSKTAGYRHGSIPDGIAAIERMGKQNGFKVDATEDASRFTPENLERYDAVVWLSTTGDVLNDTQQTAFQEYIRSGGGYVGVHAAADTEYDWPWYGELTGAWFDSHPEIQGVTVNVEDHDHPATAHLGDTWQREDELYNYKSNPREKTRVLATLDEGTYTGGNMGDHPITWCQDFEGGRSFYTGLGHTNESFTEPEYQQHLLGGIQYATGAVAAECAPGEDGEEPEYTPIFDGTSLEGWSQAGPGSFELSEEDGTITSTGGMGMLWYEARELSSYSLKLDWRMAGDDNSGVFVGFPASDDPWSAVNNGYEIQIDATDTPDRTTGSVYGFQSADLEARDAALNPPGEWNSYEIRVEGEQLQVWLNGELINEYTNTDPARSLTDGYIGLQNHGDADEVSFRDVQLKDLTPPAP